jgi:hypothetical protein
MEGMADLSAGLAAVLCRHHPAGLASVAMSAAPGKQNRGFYIKLWKTHGVIPCQRGDQLGGGKTELFLDPEKQVRVIGRAGEWFVNPETAVRAVEHRRGRELRALKRRIERLKAMPIEVRSW